MSSTMTKDNVENACAGYSMVEIALALLVFGIGMVSVFAMFPHGLGDSRKAVDATEASTFAEHVFANLQVEASLYPAASFSTPYTLPVSHALDGVAPVNTQVVISAYGATGPDSPQVYNWKPGYYGGALTPYVDNHQVAVFTYTLDMGPTPNGVDASYARLEVWSGNRSNALRNAITASTNLPGSTVFYREFWHSK